MIEKILKSNKFLLLAIFVGLLIRFNEVHISSIPIIANLSEQYSVVGHILKKIPTMLIFIPLIIFGENSFMKKNKNKK